MIADVLAGVFLAAAAYEGAAVWFDRMPTITDLVNGTPKWARWAGLAAAAAWALDHFRLVGLF